MAITSAPQDLSVAYRAFLYKTSFEGLHNVYSVGGFVVICLFAALFLLMLGNFLADVRCRKSPEQQKIRNMPPPKWSQTVYSSMLPPREDFKVGKDVVMNTADTQTPGHAVGETPDSQDSVRKKPLKIRPGDIRRTRRAERRKEKNPFKSTP